MFRIETLVDVEIKVLERLEHTSELTNCQTAWTILFYIFIFC